MRQTWILLALLGCSDDEGPAAGRDLDAGADASLDGGDAARDADSRDADADADADVGACTLRSRISSRVSAQAADCGTVAINPMTAQSDDMYQSVRSCVLDAVASGAPFFVLKEEQGIDSLVGSAFVRERQGGDVALLRGDQGFGQSTVFEERCRTLREATSCGPTQPQLCLLCEQTTEPTLLCQKARD